LREAELLDEIKIIQKAKQADKQQAQASIAKLVQENEELTKITEQVELERDSISAQFQEFKDSCSDWSAREEKIKIEISELSDNYINQILGLQEQLRSSESTISSLHSEHSVIIQKAHMRQSELEKQNMELGRDVTDKQREILRLKSSLERLGKDLYPNKELETLQNKLDKCESELEEEQERNRRLENKSKQLECEYRAMQIMLEDERLLAQERAEAFNKEISSLQEKLLQVSNGYTSKETVLSGGRGALVQAYGQSSWEGDSDISLAAMRQQLTSLGDQLLVKQGAVQRLQSENVAVHAKLKDLQSRWGILTSADIQASIPRRSLLFV